MRMVTRVIFGALLCVLIHGSVLNRALAETFVPVDFSSQANFTWAGVDSVPGEPSGIRLPGAPTGSVTLGGIPFNIKSNASGYQAWHGDVAANGGTGLYSITMPVDVNAATDVYTLINTWQGQNGTNTYAWLIITGSAGATYTDYLVGGSDIRDYNNAGWDNSINGTTTVNVFNCPVDNWGLAGRLDMQHVTLPAAFANQTLTTIQLVDDGGPNFQRVVLDGVTVASVPEPSTLLLLVVGAVGLLGYAWRRRKLAMRA